MKSKILLRNPTRTDKGIAGEKRATAILCRPGQGD
jgi:hypothetical protein